MMEKGEHLGIATPLLSLRRSRKRRVGINEGLQSIVSIRATLNIGLSEVLKAAFPDTIPVVRFLISKQEIPHPE